MLLVCRRMDVLLGVPLYLIRARVDRILYVQEVDGAKELEEL